MILLCTICSDLINASENLFVTKCGHLFHFNCLYTWVVKAKSCPQCRHLVTEKCMFRVYPTTSDNVVSEEESIANQKKLDDTLLKLNQQGCELRNWHKKNEHLRIALEASEKLIECYKTQLLNCKSELEDKKKQVLFFKTENKELTRIQDELESTKKIVNVLQRMQAVFDSTVEEVEHMLESHPDVRTVATFATALKKALCESESKKAELRNKLQAARQELAEEKKKSEEFHSKFIQLEENMAAITKKHETLKNKLKANKVKTGEMSCLEDSWVFAPATNAPPKDEPVASTSNIKLNSLIDKIVNADSPYLNLKQNSLAWVQQQPSTSKGHALIKPAMFQSTKVPKATRSASDQDLSIFHNKTPDVFAANSDEAKSKLNPSYDGLGGHIKFSDTLVPNTSRIPLKLKSAVPKLSDRHRLKRPNPENSNTIMQWTKTFKKDS